MRSITAKLLLLSTLVALFPATCEAKPSILQRPSIIAGKKKGSSPKREDAYTLLARSIQKRLNTQAESDSTEQYDLGSISSALRSLSTTQMALKKIDGTAHEMYQRTHKSSTSLDDESDGEEGDGSGGKVGGLKVAGRMSRNAARVGCIADALFAAELCELIRMAPPAINSEGIADENHNDNLYGDEETLALWTGRKVLLNTTIQSDSPNDEHGLAISVLVIYEPDYNGGAGIGHGGVDDLLSFAKEEIEDDGDVDSGPGNSTDLRDSQTPNPRGRYLVILSDHFTGHGTSSLIKSDLRSIISVLDTPPEQLRLRSRPGDNDSVNVCGPLYNMAGKLLEVIGPVLMKERDTLSQETSDRDTSDNEDEGSQGASINQDRTSQPDRPAIHVVGHSLAGGIAAMAANILDGSLPLQQKGNDLKPKRYSSLCGYGRARTSALCIGPPPCISKHLQSAFITSVLHGDDIVFRTSHGTIDQLCDRVRRSIKGGLLGRSVGWMSEAVSLTVSGLKSNDGSNKGGKLVVPGKAFLVRPRRIGGGSSSIHEVGGQGREALRAALLWQLNDVLLSKSLWAHHQLDAYIRSLDKVRLKGFSDDNSNESD